MATARTEDGEEIELSEDSEIVKDLREKLAGRSWNIIASILEQLAGKGEFVEVPFKDLDELAGNIVVGIDLDKKVVTLEVE